MLKVRTRLLAALSLPILAATLTACDIVTAEFKSQETAEWRQSYDLAPEGRVEIANVNGKIDVTPSTGNKVEVVAVKVAKAGTPEAARQALDRIEIVESVSPSAIKLETKYPRNSSFFNMGGTEVRYTVKIPATADARFRTVNGAVEIVGLKGRVNAETTNGGIQAREMGGPVEASTTNGGVDVELTQVAEPGANLHCTNGGIKLRLPADARATISASVTNGGIDTAGLALDTSQTSRRRLEARLNGGGPMIKIGGTNGGIRIASR
jgi:hypothetical protein